MITCEEVKKEIASAERELKQICNIEKGFPKGEIQCAKNQARYKWFVKNENTKIYLPRENKEFAQELALKKYYVTRKKELEEYIAGCKSFLKRMQDIEGKTEALVTHPEYGKLLEKSFTPVNRSLAEWTKQDYMHCDKHTEALIVKGTQGKMVRSKSEAIIDMLLFKNKIPFRYEDKLILDGITIYPDFTIRHPVTGIFYYWEHFGLMDDPDYRKSACLKIKTYTQNGIIPSINLIMTFEDRKNPLSIEKVENIIRDYFM